MGVCQNSDKSASRKIDVQLKTDVAKQKKTQKLLILGTGESGKSTILKQMRLLHSEGFTPEELNGRTGVIYSNIVNQIGVILNAMNELNLYLQNAELQSEARLVMGLVEADKTMEPLTDDVVTAVKALWADAGVQKCYQRRSEYQLNDSAKYFIDSIDRIAAADYTPTTQDMLFSRTPTTGVVQINFVVKNIQFSVYDVGGQRSERRKWIHCFDDVNALLFVAAISEYNQKLREDETTNRLEESINLFRSLCNSSFFAKASMILFLNKTDLFREKIEQLKIPLSKSFPTFKGDNSYVDTVGYIKRQFEQAKAAVAGSTPTSTPSLYVYETCATDCNQVQKVVKGVIDTLIKKKMQSLGLPAA